MKLIYCGQPRDALLIILHIDTTVCLQLQYRTMNLEKRSAMKKLFSLLIICALLFSLCACGSTGNKDYDYIIALLEEGNYDMAIHVIEGLRGSVDNSEESAGPVSNAGSEAVAPILNGMVRKFRSYLMTLTIPLNLHALHLPKRFLTGMQ